LLRIINQSPDPSVRYQSAPTVRKAAYGEGLVNKVALTGFGFGS